MPSPTPVRSVPGVGGPLPDFNGVESFAFKRSGEASS
jgi:hypothetical protein